VAASGSFRNIDIESRGVSVATSALKEALFPTLSVAAQPDRGGQRSEQRDHRRPLNVGRRRRDGCRQPSASTAIKVLYVATETPRDSDIGCCGSCGSARRLMMPAGMEKG